jgi:hypothetical protein
MKTLGSIMANLLPVLILGTTLGLFISLPISPTTENTLVGNICGNLEPQKAKKEK